MLYRKLYQKLCRKLYQPQGYSPFIQPSAANLDCKFLPHPMSIPGKHRTELQRVRRGTEICILRDLHPDQQGQGTHGTLPPGAMVSV